MRCQIAYPSSGTTFWKYTPITGRVDTAFVGETGITRVGSASGLAYGTVLNVDGDEVENDPTRQLHLIVLDAVEVGAGVSEGDSGGPVFLDHCSLRACGDGATLLGIEFGKDSLTGNFYYSTLFNIFSELGFNYTVYGTTVRAFGPSKITQPGSYVWNTIVTGTPGYHYQWQISYDGSNWIDSGGDSPTWAEYWQSILPNTYYPFWLRVTVTGSGTGFGQVATSDPIFAAVDTRQIGLE